MSPRKKDEPQPILSLNQSTIITDVYLSIPILTNLRASSPLLILVGFLANTDAAFL